MTEEPRGYRTHTEKPWGRQEAGASKHLLVNGRDLWLLGRELADRGLGLPAIARILGLSEQELNLLARLRPDLPEAPQTTSPAADGECEPFP